MSVSSGTCLRRGFPFSHVKRRSKTGLLSWGLLVARIAFISGVAVNYAMGGVIESDSGLVAFAEARCARSSGPLLPLVLCSGSAVRRLTRRGRPSAPEGTRGRPAFKIGNTFSIVHLHHDTRQAVARARQPEAGSRPSLQPPCLAGATVLPVS